MEGHYYVSYRMVLESVKIRYQDDRSIGLTSVLECFCLV